jgi:hypothetical protein
MGRQHTAVLKRQWMTDEHDIRTRRAVKPAGESAVVASAAPVLSAARQSHIIG